MDGLSSASGSCESSVPAESSCSDEEAKPASPEKKSGTSRVVDIESLSDVPDAASDLDGSGCRRDMWSKKG